MTRTTAPQPRGGGLLRTYLWLVLATIALTVVAALLALGEQERTYTSTAQVVVNPEMTAGGAPILPQMGTERAKVESGDVAAAAAERIGTDVETASEGLSVTVPVDTNVLAISYTAADADQARKGAEAFTREYVDYRNADSKVRVAEVISEAELPEASPPNYPLVGGLALVAGLVLGVAAAFAWDRTRDRLRGTADVRQATGLPVLASVPRARSGSDPLAPPVRIRQAFGYLAAQLTSLTENKRRDVAVLVTSPRSGAGTTTVAAQTAIALAELGRDVVLVSADVQRPSLPRLFGVDNVPGLTEVLDGVCTLERALHTTGTPGLRLLAAGASPGATVRFNLEDLELLIGRLSGDGIVVIEAPPVLEAPQCVALADRVDLAVLVTDQRPGSRSDAAAAVEILGRTDARLAGCVVNTPRRSLRRTAEPEGDTRSEWQQSLQQSLESPGVAPAVLVENAQHRAR